jgi:hypothetical protein
MKRSFASFLVLFIFFNLSAQEKHSFISLQSGPSFPVGKFRLQELSGGSFAEAGLNVTLEGAWFFKSRLGIGANAGLCLHPVNVGALGYEKVLADPFMNDVYIRSDPYRSYFVFAGPYFRFPLVDKLFFTAKALGGMIYSETPYQLYKAEYEMIGEKWFEITSSGDYEAGFLAGAGLRYDLNGCLGLALNSEFTWNKMDFDFMLPDGSIRTDEKVVSFINLSFGVLIRI